MRAGKVRYLGAASMWTWQFAKMQRAAEVAGGAKFVTMQNHYNLAYREEEREMIPYCRDTGVGITPWSPLARGFLAGNRSREDKGGGGASRAKTDELAQKYYYQDADFDVVEALTARAKAMGVSNAMLAYSWLLQKPGVTAPIVGASKPWQIEEAAKATELTLSPEDMNKDPVFSYNQSLPDYSNVHEGTLTYHCGGFNYTSATLQTAGGWRIDYPS